ncbi:transcriptional regulator [Pseudomonas ceruminis]|uniref:transcriptional regulator n=1 Tax=Pseudomonas ceruminis TaxID=2740516 RepID=UPI00159694E9|nr:YdaS family helix-turn-helix protein [Pseudomonas ceruminis]
MSIEAMSSAVEALGSQTNLAKKLGCTPQNVQRMCATGHVPAKHVLRIEAESGVSRCLLRPDLYPDPAPTLNERLPVDCVCEQSVESAVNPSSTAQASP